MKFYSLLIVLLLLAAAVPGWAQEEPLEIAILAIDVSGGIPASYAPALTDRLRQEIFLTGAFKVMERGEMDGILREIGFQQSGCTSNECLIEAGRILGVKQMVAGTVSQMGEMHTINIRVIEVKTSEIINIVSVDARCPIEEVLTNQLKQVALKLAGKEKSETFAGKGDVKVTSYPPGAVILLDGKDSGEKTPATLKDVAAGQHILRLSKGNLAETKQLTVQPDITTTVEVELKPGFGSLIVESTPPGAEISVDGVVRGISPLRLDTVMVGSHKIDLKKEGYLPKNQTITIGLYEIIKTPFDLVQQCGLVINSDPAGAIVYFGFKKQGITPLTLNGLKPGSYPVILKLLGYSKHSETVELKPGITGSFSSNLVPRSKSVSVTMSAFCPGLGQYYRGHPYKGLGFFAVEALLIVRTVQLAGEHQDAVDAYNTARAQYIAAVYPDEIAAAKANMDDKWKEADDLRAKRDGTIGLETIIYLYNIADILFWNQPPGGPGKYRFSLESTRERTDAVVTVKF